VSEFPNKATQFQPGQSGNPAGRPKERPLRDALKALLEAGDGQKIKELAKIGLEAATGGDFRFWKEVFDRIDGKVIDALDVTTGGESVNDPLEPLRKLSPELRKRVLEELGAPPDD